MSRGVDLIEAYSNYLLSPALSAPFEFILFFTIHGCFTLILFFYMHKKIKLARLLIDTPTSKIRSAAQGFIEIKGRSKSIAPLFTPLTNTPCTWYKYKVEQLTSSGRNRRWETIEEGESPVGFILYDNTDECMVHPEGAMIYPHRKRCWRGNTPRPMGMKTHRFSLTRSYRYSEEMLIPELPLFAQGIHHTFRPSTPELDFGHVMSEWKRDYQSLLKKYDYDGNGKLDEQEWQHIIKDAERELAKRQAKINAKQGAPKSVNILSCDGLIKHQTFILSGKPEKELYRLKRRVAALCCCGFSFFVLHGLYAIS